MTTTVVNIRTDVYDVYIGRSGQGHDGYFGNPYRVGKRCGNCGEIHRSPGATLLCFRVYFHKRLALDPEFKRRVSALHGKRLGCFCAPRQCHGHIIAEWLDRS